ncbi:MAG: putative Tripeptidyl-peptidase [Pedosphaera sp.]|nr:putative Tripeptidyl-peptidase [Pedosphaera sp.]
MKNNLFQKSTRQLLTGNFVVATFAALFLLSATSAWAAGLKVLDGHVPAVVARLQPVDRLPGSTHLELAIGLHVRNGEMLTNLLQQIYDPASVNYRHYLTSAQFAANFGPTEEDYQAVIGFAKANGLTVGATHSNRILLEIGGTVADIEKAFHVNLRVYQHPTEARTFYAPDVEPSLDAALQIVDISGLDNYIVPHPISLKPVPATHAPSPAAGSGPSGNFLGADFRKAYVPGVSLNGSGQTVGLLEFDGYYAADITSYESLAGLASVPLQNVLLNHVHGNPGANNVEVALDIEMAISMAPGLAKVIVYEGTSGNTILNQMATDNSAKQISASWTYGINSTTETIFQQFAAQGQSFFNASGDSDAYSGTVAPPTDDPNITIVGGTTLSTGSLGAWASETVWNWGGGSGTGGGISTTYAIPSWQQGVNMSGNHGSSSMRNLPDVALTADNIWVISNNGTGGSVGGTSCAAPLWAAFTALVNQQALANGKTTVGFVNPAIYAIGTGQNYASIFHDTTTGNNTSSTSPNNFFAVTGYDLCTGWGTPAGMELINALAGTSNQPPVFTSNPFTEASATASVPYSATLATNASDPNGAAMTFSKISGPAWLSVAANGSLSGTPSNSDAGTNGFVVRAVDSFSLSNSATMLLVVNSNLPPVFTTNPFSVSNANSGQSYTGTIATNASDPNGGTLTFSKVSGPAWLGVAGSGALSGIPANTDAGTNSFVVRVTDGGGLSNNATMAVYVNGAPSFTTNPFSHPGVNAGQPYSGTIATNATDPNGDLLTFAKLSGPAWLSIAGNGALSGTAANTNSGTNTFVVRATDSGGLFSNAVMTIYVNAAPSFTSNPFSHPGVNAGQPYSGTIATNATDPNGDLLTFSKVSGPTWLNIATNGVLSGTAANADAGTNSFVVRVADPGGLFNTASMNIVVAAIPDISMAISLQANNLMLSWNGGTAPYQLQVATNLVNPAWDNVGGPIASNSLSITPTNAAAFYRIFGQ